MPETIYIQNTEMQQMVFVCLCISMHSYMYVTIIIKENKLNLRVWLDVREFGGRVRGGNLGKRMWCNSILI